MSHSLNRRAFLGAIAPSLFVFDYLKHSLEAQTSLWGGGRELKDFPIYRQPDGISCGPTCCSMVLKWFGKSAGIGPCKTKAGTRWLEAGKVRVGMTMPDGVERCMDSYGVGSSVRRGSLSDVTKYIDQDRPPILLVRSGKDTWHYVVAVGYMHGTSKILLADPSGEKYWIEGSKLDAAWTYSRDLSGNELKQSNCGICGGKGRVAAGWTKCVTCGGSGGVTLLGRKVKCRACSGRGKWEYGGAHCVPCNGKGKEPDWYRKAVETAGVSGHTMIVPDRGRSSGSGGTGDNREKITYTIKNDARREVRFLMKPSGKQYSLGVGRTFRGTSYKENGKPPTITLLDSGRTYHLTVGDHKFWWMSRENRVGFDRSTD